MGDHHDDGEPSQNITAGEGGPDQGARWPLSQSPCQHDASVATSCPLGLIASRHVFRKGSEAAARGRLDHSCHVFCEFVRKVPLLDRQGRPANDHSRGRHTPCERGRVAAAAHERYGGPPRPPAAVASLTLTVTPTPSPPAWLGNERPSPAFFPLP